MTDAIGLRPSPSSFRDPGGCLFRANGRILRAIRPEAVADAEAFLASNTYRTFADSGRLVGTWVLDDPTATSVLDQAGDWGLVVEHEVVPFPSLAHEWPAPMLYEAGRLTLDLAEALLDEGLGLKDATPTNVLYRGPQPVFIDLLSVEARVPGDPLWRPQAQFLRTFYLPLLVNRRFGIPLSQIFLGQPGGLEPEDVYRLATPLDRLSPSFLMPVSIPTWLAGKAGRTEAMLYQERRLDNLDKATFILRATLRQARRSLRRVEPRARTRSAWTDYATVNSYNSDDLAAKEGFVAEALDRFRPARVLDVGCNTGKFSRLAARNGARVVAIDSDPEVVAALWHTARDERLDVLPLVADLARPSPAIGWRNAEWPSFLDRARGSFDAVLMLAVVHHLLVTERIPLDQILALTAELTGDLAVVEFVAPADPMFRRLARGRDALFAGLTAEVFEAACRPHFEIVQAKDLSSGTRRLYLLRKRGATS